MIVERLHMLVFDIVFFGGFRGDATLWRKAFLEERTVDCLFGGAEPTKPQSPFLF